jgi:uncharacterized phage protein gp47/JayE
MVDLPTYLTEQTADAILTRMLAALPAKYNKSPGSRFYSIFSPIAAELAQDAIQVQQNLERSFGSTTKVYEYLVLRAAEIGLEPDEGTPSTGTVIFTGAPGTVIDADTRVATPSSVNNPSVIFETDVAATIAPGETTVEVAVTATSVGTVTNVGAGTVIINVDTVAGVTGVTNEDAFTGGTDAQSFESLRTEYLARLKRASHSGNIDDHLDWATDVAGVGYAAVDALWDGNGTVKVAIADTAGDPATQTLVDAVQEYIAPRWEYGSEAEMWTVYNANGVTTDDQPDDIGTSKKMVHSVTAAGELRVSISALLIDDDGNAEPGNWGARLRVKVNSAAGVLDLLEWGVYNVSEAAWADTSATLTTDAMQTLQGNDMLTSFDYEIQPFFYDGVDDLQLRVKRLQTDTTTQLWVDRVVLLSDFSKDTGDGGKAPVGQKVTVVSPDVTEIDVAANITYVTGYDPAIVDDAIEDAIRAYLKTLIFRTDEDGGNDVSYNKIAVAIEETEGVNSAATITVNGGTANITIDPLEMAVFGTGTWT